MHNPADMLIWRGKYRALDFVTLINKLFPGSGAVGKIPNVLKGMWQNRSL